MTSKPRRKSSASVTGPQPLGAAAAANSPATDPRSWPRPGRRNSTFRSPTTPAALPSSSDSTRKTSSSNASTRHSPGSRPTPIRCAAQWDSICSRHCTKSRSDSSALSTSTTAYETAVGAGHRSHPCVRRCTSWPATWSNGSPCSPPNSATPAPLPRSPPHYHRRNRPLANQDHRPTSPHITTHRRPHRTHGRDPVATARHPDRHRCGRSPQVIRIDRGKDFLSGTVAAACAVFVVRIADLPGYTPHLKGSVETLNGAAKSMFFAGLPRYAQAPRLTRTRRRCGSRRSLTSCWPGCTSGTSTRWTRSTG
jgi:hypothetical protein